MQTYNIQIDEAQRQAIEDALAKFPPSVTEEEAENDVVKFGVRYLLNMIQNLPQEEKESPGCTHGLCV